MTKHDTSTSNVSEDLAIAPQNLHSLRRFVSEQTGILVEGDQSSFFETRLAPVMLKNQIANLDVLCCLMRVSGNERLRRAVVDAVSVKDAVSTNQSLLALAAALPHQ